MSETTAPLPDFTRWPSFPFEGDMRVKNLAPPVEVEPPRSGEDAADCVACGTPDDAYIWVSERWRVRAMDRPTGLPMVLILECRSHLDLGDLPNMLAAELGVMTVRLERAIRSLDGVARVHVNRWGDGSAHLHMWFLARPYGRLQLRGTFLSLWDDILPVIPEAQWRENLALVAAWLADFGGKANAEPAHIAWQSPATFSAPTAVDNEPDENRRPATLGDIEAAATPAPAEQTEPEATQGDAPTHQPSPATPSTTTTTNFGVRRSEAPSAATNDAANLRSESVADGGANVPSAGSSAGGAANVPAAGSSAGGAANVPAAGGSAGGGASVPAAGGSAGGAANVPAAGGPAGGGADVPTGSRVADGAAGVPAESALPGDSGPGSADSPDAVNGDSSAPAPVRVTPPGPH